MNLTLRSADADELSTSDKKNKKNKEQKPQHFGIAEPDKGESTAWLTPHQQDPS